MFRKSYLFFFIMATMTFVQAGHVGHVEAMCSIRSGSDFVSSDMLVLSGKVTMWKATP